MAETIKMHEQLGIAGGEGSGNIASQSTNNSNLRLRRPPLVGYSVSTASSTSYSPDCWANIRQIALNIVALNVTTLRALRDGWYGSPQIISRCCDKYENYLTKEEVEILDWTAEDGGLDENVLEILKLKVLALQEHYRDATMAVIETPHDLIDEARDDWWNSDVSQASSSHHNRSPVAVAKAYEVGSVRLISNLSFFVPVVLLLSCIPITLAWTHSPRQIGKLDDPNFYQLIASSLIQLLSLATLLYPTLFHSRFSGHSWFWTWVLAMLSVLCTILSVSLYDFLPVTWSMVIAFGGMIAQALITLQIIHAI